MVHLKLVRSSHNFFFVENITYFTHSLHIFDKFVKLNSCQKKKKKLKYLGCVQNSPHFFFFGGFLENKKAQNEQKKTKSNIKKLSREEEKLEPSLVLCLDVARPV